VKPGARHVVFHCFDDLDGSGGRYYEVSTLHDAFHPQTIVAHALNGAPRTCRQRRARCGCGSSAKLGYKQPKYVHTIEVVDAYTAIGGRQGRLLGRQRV
jgi:DMSO/TMAO reductase YedYZ molybdopterin-dependent catalytic subunit